MTADKEQVGLLAGWGSFPIEVATALKAQGKAVHCLAIKGHADPRLAEICDAFRVFGIAKLGGQIRYMRRHGIGKATMAGKIFKAKLMFDRFWWLWHFPDWRCIKTFYPHFITHAKDRTDDTLVTSFVDEFAKDGIVFAPPTDFAPELLVAHGQLCGSKLTNGQVKDIQFGWKIAKEMGRLDVGQSVAIKGQVCVAVEAVEGTDECIRRAGQLCNLGGFTLVKVAKPQQDMRFDVPTIGTGTIENLAAAGASVLALEADKTIVVDREQVARTAERVGLKIVAVYDGDASAFASRKAG